MNNVIIYETLADGWMCSVCFRFIFDRNARRRTRRTWLGTRVRRHKRATENKRKLHEIGTQTSHDKYDNIIWCCGKGAYCIMFFFHDCSVIVAFWPLSDVIHRCVTYSHRWLRTNAPVSTFWGYVMVKILWSTADCLLVSQVHDFSNQNISFAIRSTYQRRNWITFINF